MRLRESSPFPLRVIFRSTTAIHPMKPAARFGGQTSLRRPAFSLALVAAFSAALVGEAGAATRTKAATGTDLSLAAAWDTLPGSGDTALWATGSLGGALTLGSTQTWGAIDIESATSSLSLTGSALTLSGGQTINGVASSGLYVASGGQDLTVANNIALGANQVWTAGAGRTVTTSGVLSGAYTLTYGGAGTYVIGGVNTNSGNLTISGATVKVNSGATLFCSSLGWSGRSVTISNGGTLEAPNFGNGAGSLWGQCGDSDNNVILQSGGVFRMTGATMDSTVNKGITANSGTGYFQVPAGNNVTWNGNYSGRDFNADANCTLAFDIGSGGSFTTTRTLRGNGNITKDGAGTLTVNANGTGSLVLRNGGTLTVANGSLIVNKGATWYDTIFGNTASTTYNQTGGTATFNTGELDIANNAGSGGTSVNVSGGSFAVAGISGTSSKMVILGIRGNATFNISGTADVNIPRFQFGHSGAAVNTTTSLNLNGGTLTTNEIVRSFGTPTVNFNGGTLKAGASSTTFLQGLSAANVQNGGAIIDTNGFDITIGQALLNGGTGGLTKNGSGTLTLSGSNTYTGATTVAAGVLAITNASALAGSSVIDVKSGATLDVSGASGWSLGAGQELKGNGTLGGSVAITGTLAPGNSIGTLSFGSNLTLSGLSDFEINQDNTTADLADVNGALTFGGTLNVTSLGSGGYTLNQTFDLFDFTTSSGMFSSMSLPDLSGQGYVWDTNNLYTAGTITVVPEPTGILLGSLGLLALLRRRRP